MTKKARYFLIGLCFALFIILTPIIILYVRGLAFDLKTGHFYTTGILAAKIDPADSEIYLNGKLTKKSEGSIKFLKPQDYTITIKKNGFEDWKKTLTVNDSEVTWINPADNKIFLFLKNPKQTVLEKNILDFTNIKNRSFYLTANRIIWSNWIAPFAPQYLDLNFEPKALQSFTNKNYLLITGLRDEKIFQANIFDTSSKKLFDISGLISPDSQIFISADNNFYSLEKNNLYQLDILAQTKILAQKNILAAYFNKDNFYYITKDGNSDNILFAAAGPNSQSVSQIANNLPNFKFAQIFVNYEKKIYLRLDNQLYKISDKAELIASDIKDLKFNQDSFDLTLVFGSELANLDWNTGNLNIITRAVTPIEKPYFAGTLDYCLFAKDNKIYALELDTRDRQNQYLFYEGKNIVKFSLSDDSRHILILDNGELKTLEIR